MSINFQEAVKDYKDSILTTMIDELTAEIIIDQSLRVEKFKSLKYFLRHFPEDLRHEKEENELMAMILTAVSCLDPYDTAYQDCKKSPSESSDLLLEQMPVPPLMYWSYDHWEALSDFIFKLMSMLQAEEDDALEEVMQTISLNQKLAKIRLQIEEQLSSGDDTSGCLKIQEDAALEFFKSISKIDNVNNQRELSNLIIIKNNTDINKTRSGRRKHESSSIYSFKELQDLKSILRSEPFEFHSFIRKVDILIGKWAWKFTSFLKEYYNDFSKEGEKSSPGTKAVKESFEESSSSEQISSSKKNYFSEEEDHQEASDVKKRKQNPNSESVTENPEKNNIATITSKNIVEQKNHGIRIESEDELGLKERKCIKSAQENQNNAKKMYEQKRKKRRADEFTQRQLGKRGGAITDSDDSEAGDKNAVPLLLKKRRRRVPWTTSEKDAIKEGIQQFGIGQWAKIRIAFFSTLGERTSVQIKDQYRTMLKRGEL